MNSLSDSPQFDAEPSDDVRVFLGQTATFECRVSQESAMHQPKVIFQRVLTTKTLDDKDLKGCILCLNMFSSQ